VDPEFRKRVHNAERKRTLAEKLNTKKQNEAAQ